jgi:hypothetical protein
MIPIELLLLDDPDVLGVLWKGGLDSFSLFSRVPDLPGCTAATEMRVAAEAAFAAAAAAPMSSS